jgi:UDP-GlcNAc:undecaprenyl-phosphate GlcNAc-1-phosphate transferase
MLLSLTFFLIGFFVTFIVTPYVIALSKRGIGLDEANEGRKRHGAPVPRIGGAPIMLAVSIGLLCIMWIQVERAADWFPMLLGTVLIFGLGLWDDLKPLGAKKKLAGQIAIASLVYWLGMSIDRVTYPGSHMAIDLGPWSYVVTVFWLIAVPNIINLIDGFDGLASGLGMFMALTLGIVGLFAQQLSVAWYSFTLAGALLGFLTFNFPPAKIFLGDGGAYLIGFCIAALSLTSSHKGSVGAVLVVTVVTLGLPILDTSFALARRAFRGFPLFHADDEHIHHRLENLGFSKRRIVLGMYGICVVLSVVALSIFWSQGRTIPIAIGVIFLLAVFSARYLQYIGNWTDLRRQVERVWGRRRNVQYALLQARLLEMELDRCGSGEEFWRLFDEALGRIGFVLKIERCEGDYIDIQVKHNGSRPWTLHVPRERQQAMQWIRVAECFRPVYIRALAKWGR